MSFANEWSGPNGFSTERNFVTFGAWMQTGWRAASAGAGAAPKAAPAIPAARTMPAPLRAMVVRDM